MATEKKPKALVEAVDSLRKTSSTSKTEFYSGRNSLGNYIQSPENYDPTRVIAYDDEFVVVRDMYPKSQIHYLVLPREMRCARQHPIEALGEKAFLARMRQKVEQVKEMVVRELEKEIVEREWSEKEGGRTIKEINGGNDGGTEEDEVASKEGLLVSKPSDSAAVVATAAADECERDWERKVMVGIHARPSMNHLHVHVLSNDLHSTWMKHRKHYNSFTTRFFISLEDFPIAKDDARRSTGRAESYLKSDLKCWRCGLNFGNRFSSLKKHLAREFEEYKRTDLKRKN